jgi:thiol-disulfide isomerase/thioredoxin
LNPSLRRAAAIALALPLASCSARPGARSGAHATTAGASPTATAPAAPAPVAARAVPAARPAQPAPVASPPRDLVAGPIPFDARDQTLEAALSAARGRPVAMYFLATWCGFCRKMEARTLSDREVQAAMADWYDVAVDPDSPVGKTLASRYTSGAYPTTVLFDARGNVRQRLVGAGDPAQLAAALRANR